MKKQKTVKALAALILFPVLTVFLAACNDPYVPVVHEGAITINPTKFNLAKGASREIHIQVAVPSKIREKTKIIVAIDTAFLKLERPSYTYLDAFDDDLDGVIDEYIFQGIDEFVFTVTGVEAGIGEIIITAPKNTAKCTINVTP